MKPIILIGCAPCWKDDLDKLKVIVDDFDVMAIGLDCPYSGQIKYFVTYHLQDIPIYKMRRRNANYNSNFLVIGYKKDIEVDIIELHKNPTGSSALLGVVAAIRLGYKKIILCGCPMEGKSREKFGRDYNHFQKGWISRFSEIKDFTRSMSGYTKEILGKPIKEWINDIQTSREKCKDI